MELYDFYIIQAYLSRDTNGNSGDMVFSNMGQFWWNGCKTLAYLELDEVHQIAINEYIL